MSPFTHQQELWLTGHIQRLAHQEQAVKIQAIARGFLVRRRREKKEKADRVLNDVLRRLQVPRQPVSVVELMRQLGLEQWIAMLPTADMAVRDWEARAVRERILWNACISLRMTGQSDSVADLQWADYHERYRALQATVQIEEPGNPAPRSMWSRFTQWIWGH